MFPGDIIIFINESGETLSFVRDTEPVWKNPAVVNGFPSDEDIARIKGQSDRKWIHIRGEYIVGNHLKNNPFKAATFEKVTG